MPPKTKYKFLTEDAQERIRAEKDAPPAPTVDDATLAAWEAAHYGHTVNVEKLEADKSLDKETKDRLVAEQKAAIKTLEGSLAKHSK